jgi:hypothetical protein
LRQRGAEPEKPKTAATKMDFSGVVGQKFGVQPDAINKNVNNLSRTNTKVPANTSSSNPVKKVVQSTLKGASDRVDQYKQAASKAADKITNPTDTIKQMGDAAKKYVDSNTVGDMLMDAATAYAKLSPANVLYETGKSNFAPLVSLAQGDFESFGSQYVDHLAKGLVVAATEGAASALIPEVSAAANARTAIQGSLDPAVSSAGGWAPSNGGWMSGSSVFGTDAATAINASRMVPESGVHQVLLHGTPDNFVVDGSLVSPKDLARTMLESGFQKGTPVRLISCNTGIAGDGAASQLSRYLKSPVMAPTNKIRTLEGGSYEIFGGGRFRTFNNTKIE